VGRLIDRVVEHGVGRDDPQYANRQKDRDRNCPAYRTAKETRPGITLDGLWLLLRDGGSDFGRSHAILN